MRTRTTRNRRRPPVMLTLTAAALMHLPNPASVLATDRVYWTDTDAGRLERAELDGDDRELIHSRIHPAALAVDAQHGSLYYSVRHPAGILRSDLDGSNAEVLIDDLLVDPVDLELDLHAGHMYWTESIGGRVQRANLDGTERRTLYAFNAIAPTGLAIDPDAGWLYFSDSTNDVIFRAPIEGVGDPEVVVGTDLFDPYDVEIDPVTRRLVWTEPGPSRISAADLDGSHREVIFVANAIAPAGLAIDARRGMLYFTDIRTLRIIRIDYDLTLLETIADVDIVAPARIDLELDRPSPNCLSLDVQHLVAGERAGFTITHGTPGAQAVTVYGFHRGMTTVDHVAGYCATFGIDGVKRNRVVGGFHRTFDAHGEIHFVARVPRNTGGIEVLFQSAEQGTCPNECTSNVVQTVIR